MILVLYAFLTRVLRYSIRVLAPFSQRMNTHFIDRYKQYKPLRVKSWFVASSLGESKLVENVWNIDGRINELSSLTVLQTPWALESMLRRHPRGNFRLNPLDCRDIWRSWLLESKPNCVYLVEGELWPNLLLECQVNGVKVRWVSALITPRVMKRWSFLRSGLIKVLADVWVSCADENTHHFLEKINVKSRMGLSLKPLGLNGSESSKNLKSSVKFEVACISWHYSELSEWGEKVLGFKRSVVVQLRHLNELVMFKQWFKAKGQIYTMWPNVLANTPCLVAEFGITQAIVENSELVVMGGSFSKNIGVHNVLEPLSMGKKVLVGPWIENSKVKEWKELFDKGLLIKIASSFEKAIGNGIPDEKVFELYKNWFDLHRAKQIHEWNVCVYENEG